MATSGAYTITVTAQNLIEAAMQSLGLLASGASATTAELTDGIRVLNYWLLQMKGRKNGLARGLKQWQIETAELTLSAKSAFNLQPSGGDLDIQIPEEIITVLLRSSDGAAQPIEPEVPTGIYTAAPANPTAGLIVFADGINWDPLGLAISKAYRTMYLGATSGWGSPTDALDA